jgi:hypothetical protein
MALKIVTSGGSTGGRASDRRASPREPRPNATLGCDSRSSCIPFAGGIRFCCGRPDVPENWLVQCGSGGSPILVTPAAWCHSVSWLDGRGRWRLNNRACRLDGVGSRLSQGEMTCLLPVAISRTRETASRPAPSASGEKMAILWKMLSARQPSVPNSNDPMATAAGKTSARARKMRAGMPPVAPGLGFGGSPLRCVSSGSAKAAKPGGSHQRPVPDVGSAHIQRYVRPRRAQALK